MDLFSLVTASINALIQYIYARTLYIDSLTPHIDALLQYIGSRTLYIDSLLLYIDARTQLRPHFLESLLPCQIEAYRFNRFAFSF